MTRGQRNAVTPRVRWNRCAVLVTMLACGGCRSVAMAVQTSPAPCRAGQSVPVRWMAPDDRGQRERLYSWCRAVGPMSYYEPSPMPASRSASALAIVSWNVGVGRGRLAEFVRDLRAQQTDSGLVVLLQEAYRAGDLPGDCGPDARRARRLGRRRHGESVLAVANDLGLYGLYIPSMRNGADCREEPREDRGNAILSTLPLADIVAIELPLGRQRRVAVGATVRIGSRAVRVVSVHFDTSPFAHQRQADALAKALDAVGAPADRIVGGDFNAAFPDPGIVALRRHLREVDCGDAPTHDFPALRLDRMFTGGNVSIAGCVTGPHSYGSDHWPLIARVGAGP